jgi:uncharacterized membrane protein
VKTAAGYLSMIVLSLWAGGMFLFTFIITPVIFRSYPRDTAGEIVGKLFPSYFLFSLVVSIAALVFFLLSFQGRASLTNGISLGLVSLAIVLSLYVNFRLYPEIKRVKQEVHSFEKTAPNDPARARFRRLHAQSAIINLLLMADSLALLIMNVGTGK